MVECPFSGKEFDSKEEMHLHWREHWDELNSHQKEKVKKAERKKEEKREAKIRRRKKKAGYGLGAAIGVALIAVIGIQLMQYSPGTQTVELEGLEDRPVYGDEDAPVTIVEFGDYLCPACRTFETQTKDRLDQEGYFDDGDINFQYVHLPVIGNRVDSTSIAVGAECVAEQDHDEFWDFHSSVFQSQDGLRNAADIEQDLVQIAGGLDIDEEEFSQCLENQDTRDIVEDDQAQASSHGFDSTPTVIVNDEVVRNWDYDSMVSLIEEELED